MAYKVAGTQAVGVGFEGLNDAPQEKAKENALRVVMGNPYKAQSFELPSEWKDRYGTCYLVPCNDAGLGASILYADQGTNDFAFGTEESPRQVEIHGREGRGSAYVDSDNRRIIQMPVLGE